MSTDPNRPTPPRWLASAGLAGALALAGCSGGPDDAGENGAASPSASIYEPNPNVNRPVEPAGDARYRAMRDMGYRLEWTGFAVVPNRREVKYVDVWDDILAVHETGNSLSVLEVATGALRWNLKLDERLAKFVGTARTSDGDLVSVSETEAYILDDQTGVLSDRQDIAVLANTRPLAFGLVLVIGGASGEVIGHNLATGYKSWGYQLSAPIRADPVPVGNFAGVVSDAGEVVVLDPRDGTSVMRTTLYDGIDTSPVASPNLVFVAGRDQSVWAFNTVGGDVRWRVRTQTPLETQPTLHDGRLLIELPLEGLVAFDANTGERLWAIEDVRGEVVAERDGRLIVWDGRTMSSINPRRGGLVEQAELPGVAFVASERFVDGQMYLVERSGRIQRYSPR